MDQREEKHMRFLHTSDWHLGRLFHGIHLTEDQAYILEQFLSLVREYRPDAIVIAGDIYDRAVPPVEAVELLNHILSQILLDYKIPIIMIAGNHDSGERLGFGSRLLAGQGLYVAGTLSGDMEPVILYDVHGPVYFAPIAFAEPAYARACFACPGILNHDQAMQAAVQKAVAGIPAKTRSVAIAHAFILGGMESESERPLSVGGSGMVNSALFEPFSYTALGHLHNPQQAGNPLIHYSGSLLKYSFAEASQKKSIHLVELDNAGHAVIEKVLLSPRHDVRCLEGYFENLLHNDDDAISKDYLSITLLDEVPILDAMGRLREKYPHVLALESPRFIKKGLLNGLPKDHRKLSEKELFAAFFYQMTGKTMSSEEQLYLAEVIERVYSEEREARV